jgi:hypothetical protein
MNKRQIIYSQSILNKNCSKSAYLIGYIFFIITLQFFVSCNNKNDTDFYFNKLITIKPNNYEETFPSIDLSGIENINNKYYKKLYKERKTINTYLLEKANSEKETNWYNYPFYFKMKEGDIAIKLLLEINEVDFNKIIPLEILNEYNKNGARIWWEYLHENREKIIELIMNNI